MTNTQESIVELVAECCRRGIFLSVAASGVKCAAPVGVMTDELRTAIASNRDVIRDLLLSEVASTGVGISAADGSFGDRRPLPAVTEWPAEIDALADLTMLLSVDDLPTAPFDFGAGRVVVDRQKFLRSIQGDVRSGADGPCALLGSLQDDLRRRRDLVIKKANYHQTGTTCMCE